MIPTTKATLRCTKRPRRVEIDELTWESGHKLDNRRRVVKPHHNTDYQSKDANNERVLSSAKCSTRVMPSALVCLRAASSTCTSLNLRSLNIVI